MSELIAPMLLCVSPEEVSQRFTQVVLNNVENLWFPQQFLCASPHILTDMGAYQLYCGLNSSGYRHGMLLRRTLPYLAVPRPGRAGHCWPCQAGAWSGRRGGRQPSQQPGAGLSTMAPGQEPGALTSWLAIIKCIFPFDIQDYLTVLRLKSLK